MAIDKSVVKIVYNFCKLVSIKKKKITKATCQAAR